MLGVFLRLFLEGTSDASDVEQRLKGLENELQRRRNKLQRLRRKKEKEILRNKEEALKRELLVSRMFNVNMHVLNFHVPSFLSLSLSLASPACILSFLKISPSLFYNTSRPFF